MPSQIRADQIVDLNGSGPPQFPNGLNVPAQKTLNVSGRMNVSGVTTISSLSASYINVSGVCTAGFFVGDGSSLTNLQALQKGKAAAFAFLSI